MGLLRRRPSGRPLAELTTVPDPAWPQVERWVQAAGATVLPGAPEAREQTLHALQVTTRTTLGAMALHTSGVLVDGGWLRLLGGAGSDLVDLATASRARPGRSPGSVVVAVDVLGGRWALNGGALPVAVGEVGRFDPRTLRWEGTGGRHADFLQWALGPRQRPARWPGWQADVAALPLDRYWLLDPPVWRPSGPDLSSRREVTLEELVAAQEDARADVAS